MNWTPNEHEQIWFRTFSIQFEHWQFLCLVNGSLTKANVHSFWILELLWLVPIWYLSSTRIETMWKQRPATEARLTGGNFFGGNFFQYFRERFYYTLYLIQLKKLPKITWFQFLWRNCKPMFTHISRRKKNRLCYVKILVFPCFIVLFNVLYVYYVWSLSLSIYSKDSWADGLSKFRIYL